MDNLLIPEHLVAACNKSPDRKVWLDGLSESIRNLREQWSLRLGPPITENASCSWVAPCVREDGTPTVLKVGLPHMEAEQEIDGLLFWNGDPTVFVLESDKARNAMLLERCEPGMSLRSLPEPQQDEVIADVLKRARRRPSGSHPFRSLKELISNWVEKSLTQLDEWPDPGLAKEGCRLLKELSRDSSDEMLLMTDLHAGNVLRAQRESWLAIDPKPFIGDSAYDATQHLINCPNRLRTDSKNTVERLAQLLEVDSSRVHRWTFARLAAEPGRNKEKAHDLARELNVG